MIRVYAKDLLPAFASGISKVEVHVAEGLVDLVLDVGGELWDCALWVPTA